MQKGIVAITVLFLFFQTGLTFAEELKPSKKIRESFLCDPIDLIQVEIKDEVMAKNLIQITRVSPYIGNDDLKGLMHALGVHDVFPDKNKIYVKDRMIKIKGTRLFCMQCLNVISKLSLTQNIKTQDFKVLGAGFASGETDEYRALLKKLGLRADVDS